MDQWRSKQLQCLFYKQRCAVERVAGDSRESCELEQRKGLAVQRDKALSILTSVIDRYYVGCRKPSAFLLISLKAVGVYHYVVGRNLYLGAKSVQLFRIKE